MDRAAIGLILTAILLVILFLGVPIGFGFIMVAIGGLVWVTGFKPSLTSIALIAFESTTNYSFAVIPLFLLMSAFVSRSGIGRDAYETARAWLGHLRGGLAMATVGGSGLFAACVGSSFAGVVAMAKVAYPEMKRFKYADTLSAGVIAAGGTLGILIPPSMAFVLIGILTNVSIGKLFMAGILPGLFQILFYIGTIYILCRRNPSLGPGGPKTDFKQKAGSLKLTWPVILLFLLIMGGIYGGVFTPTEAGGVGAFGALVIGLASRQLNRTGFFESLLDTGRSAAMMILLLMGAFIFIQFLALTRIPNTASEFIVGLGLPRYSVLIVILLVYIILGMFFDIFSMLILTVPVLFPTVLALGFDPIWYGVLMVRVAEIGCVTPPYGINLFAFVATVEGASVGTLYRGVIPFLMADFLNIALLIAVPSISTFLPSLM
ncbi:MAG: hypothetical protein A2144_03715 [Chloroflexi bacterium RBG_16_50_9]|nr:MAG: hypothetical protein A2144_03715 [Chloroflexi bacterium RBG_16_50_9]